MTHRSTAGTEGRASPQRRSTLREDVPIAVGTVLVGGIGLAIGLGISDSGTTLLVLVLAAVIVPSCWKMTGPHDPWLWWLASVAYLAKLAGAGARFWILIGPYGGVGDAGGYHAAGQRLSALWRQGQIPGLDGAMGEGTQALRWITGVLYTPYKPTFLGGFFLFASLAFVGQMLFYAAFRHAFPEARLLFYALGIFLLPSLVFWPSSIGKESIILLFLGMATYGLVRSFVAYSSVWLMVASVGVLGVGVIRPHIAALLAGSFAVAVLIGKGQPLDARAAFRRVVVLVGGLALLGVTVITVADQFRLREVGDVDPFVNGIQTNTQQGGSEVEGEIVRSISDVPAGVLRVLFRPLVTEADTPQAVASALEGTLLMGIIIWRLPMMIRRLRTIRRHYALMSLTFTAGFAVAFSAIFNLGILARQRSQALPYLLVVIVVLGWREDETQVDQVGSSDASGVAA